MGVRLDLLFTVTGAKDFIVKVDYLFIVGQRYSLIVAMETLEVAVVGEQRREAINVRR
jgi:hypothetical protein